MQGSGGTEGQSSRGAEGRGCRAFSLHAANLLTAARVLLTPLFVGAVWCAERCPLGGLFAVAVFAAVASSDMVDGYVARRRGTDSSAGRTFDHFADVGFILSALSTYVLLGIAPWWVPGAVGGSFAFYVCDSWSRPMRGVPRLVGSRIGHVAGVCNYTLVAILAFNNTAGLHLLSAARLEVLFLLVPLYSTAAVVTRLASRRVTMQATGVVAGSQ